jgi:hypothetical protein
MVYFILYHISHHRVSSSVDRGVGMAEPDLTPLDRVPGFTDELRGRLRPYWITSAEEFASLSRLTNVKHQTGLRALGFASLLQALMDGGRVGFATDQFNLCQAVFVSALSEAVRIGWSADARSTL